MYISYQADIAPQLVVPSAVELPPLPQLIKQPGESGGVLTHTEFQISKFCAQHKLKKYTAESLSADGLLAMIKKKDFVPEDIHFETIWELE